MRTVHVRLLGVLSAIVGFAACPAPPNPYDDETCVEAPQLVSVSSEELRQRYEVGASPSGMAVCEGGWFRATARECVTELITPGCAVSESCPEVPNCGPGGVCIDGWDGCYCDYPCASDADCSADTACLCTAGVVLDDGGYEMLNNFSKCLPATCRSDEDCPLGRCGVSRGPCGPAALFCRNPDNDDCTDDPSCNCFFDEDTERWRCGGGGACE